MLSFMRQREKEMARIFHDAGTEFARDKSLGRDDYEYAARALGLRISMPAAFAHVESLQQPFGPSGRPILRLEKRPWEKLAYSPKAAREIQAIKVLNPGDQIKRWENFDWLYSVDPVAAIKACSWGAWQIMGFNHSHCQFEDPFAFKEAMEHGAGAQTVSFVRFVQSGPRLLRAMHERDFPGMAAQYNGSGYARNRYDIKLRQADQRMENVLSA